MFAGSLLLLLATLNFIEGIAAIGNSHFFAHANYMVGSLNTRGWIVLCIGLVEWCVGVGVFVKNQFSRWVGVFVLGLNAIAQLMMLNARPFFRQLRAEQRVTRADRGVRGSQRARPRDRMGRRTKQASTQGRRPRGAVLAGGVHQIGLAALR